MSPESDYPRKQGLMEKAEYNEQPIQLTIPYSNLLIPVSLCFEERERLRISVKLDKSIIAKAPFGYAVDDVREKLVKRAPWIVRQLEYFDQYHPLTPERQYISGETYYYLGRQYRLRVFSGKINQVKLIGKFFLVTTTQAENIAKKKELLQNWYSDHAKVLINNRFHQQITRVLNGVGKIPIVKFRKMNKRWGSCTPSGIITFNIDLIKAPIHCIDYVILHEICHLIRAGHDQQFYRLLETLMPDWRRRKERLEKINIV